MAKDRLYELDGKKGHWYTDEQGNRYFVAQGQTPKEGWEATKRRKMIKGGKYVKDDGDDKGEQEISANEYQTYEADEEERFDVTTDADFEDDEPEDFDKDDWKDDEIPNLNDVRKFLQNHPEYEDVDIHEFQYDDGEKVLTGDIRKDGKLVARLEFDEDGNPVNNHGQVYSEIDFSEGLDRDPLIDPTDDDDERSWGPGAKRIERRAKDIEQLRKMGWDDDRIINAFVDQGYDEMDVEDFLNSKKASDEGERRSRSLFELGAGDPNRKVTFEDDEDGTNGWKPSEEATPAYDVGGFYSINEGDRWEYDGGGFVEVHNVAGENVEITTPSGTEWVTKDELSDMVKNAWKVPGKKKSKSGKQGPAKKAESKNAEPKSDKTIEKEVHSYKGGIEGVDDHIKDICDRYGCRFITSNKINDDTVEVCIGGVNGNQWFRIKNTGSDANPYWYGGPQLVDYIKKSAERSENTINTAFDYLKGLYDDPETRVSAIRKTVERFPNATNYEIGRVMEKLIEYSKGKK